MFERSAGILLHITSLPGRFGLGDLGTEAMEFLDFLAAARQRWWQMLPLNPPGYGNSPYQCWSAFAGNPLLISPDSLLEEGLLHESDFADLPAGESGDRVDFGLAFSVRPHLIGLAFARFEPGDDYRRFCEEERGWLEDAALFRGLSDEHEGRSWTEWDAPLVHRDPDAMEEARERLAESVEYHRFAQYLFFRQHARLRERAAERGIGLIGDIPIFVAHNSADVWANQDLFSLDEGGNPTVVAGVPPDYFSSTGQRWGNPLYRWDVMAERGYDWWIARLRGALRLYDAVRIDHFRGFESYWEIPATEETAVNGRWMPGPGGEFFKAVAEAIDSPAIFAEDLGVITPEVESLREEAGLAGMKVLQFGVGDPRSPHLPHNYASPGCVVYTGTHDNDTTLGWWQSLDRKGKDFMRMYTGRGSLGKRRKEEVPEEMIRLAYSTVAALAVVPMQDLLGLGSEARMNVPGAADDANWSWRMRPDTLTPDHAERLAFLTEMYARRSEQ